MVEAINSTEQKKEETQLPMTTILESPSKNDRLKSKLEEAQSSLNQTQEKLQETEL